MPPEAVMIIDGAGDRAVAWATFAAANPDIADGVARDIARCGFAYVGGGAAPFALIVPTQS